MEELQGILRKYMLRREKRDVELTLPKKTVNVIEVRALLTALPRLAPSPTHLTHSLGHYFRHTVRALLMLFSSIAPALASLAHPHNSHTTSPIHPPPTCSLSRSEPSSHPHNSHTLTHNPLSTCSLSRSS